MRFFTLAAALVAPLLVSAAPTKHKRASDVDITVLSAYHPYQEHLHLLIPLCFSYIEFAEILEQLETEFYKQALAKFVPKDFTDAGITLPEIAIQGFQSIFAHEGAHTLLYVPQQSTSSPRY